MARRRKELQKLSKVPTGISGFDEISFGGLPLGRPTLVAGIAGSGKTLFGVEFLARGAQVFSEPGVLMSFEESSEDLIKNFSSLGFDLQALIDKRLLVIDHVTIERSEIEETGEYNLDGLFIRLNYAIKSINAKRVLLDTIETLFSGLVNENILRAELRRLFRWLKERGVTAVITGERGKETLTRHGLEEYIADCVILLDHTVNDRIATRRMRLVKYRGSEHGSDEYPFLISESGISVLPITSLRLEHIASSERVSTGVKELDTMMEGRGFYRGSSILVSGTAGTGKSTLAAHFVNASCSRKEKVIYFAFEESASAIQRNMNSIGIDLENCQKTGLLQISASRPTMWGLEIHLARMHKTISEFKPRVIVVDPISNMVSVGSLNEVKSMLIRLIDFIKESGITALFTDLITTGESSEFTEVGISSLMDTWILLRDIELFGERNRGIYVLKARGMNHSNQIREFLITEKGIDIIDVYTGPSGVLTGSARAAQEAKERATELIRKQDLQKKQRELDRKKKILESQMNLLKIQYEGEEEELQKSILQDKLREKTIYLDRSRMSIVRKSKSKSEQPIVPKELADGQ